MNNGRNSINIDLNEALSDDILWFMGMWFTDGTSSYKSEVTICSKDVNVNSRLYRVLKDTFKSKQKQPTPYEGDGCTYTRFGLSKTWFIKLFIYDNVAI